MTNPIPIHSDDIEIRLEMLPSGFVVDFMLTAEPTVLSSPFTAIIWDIPVKFPFICAFGAAL
jgi:hypothetical protein